MSNEDRWQIAKLRALGYSQVEIANQLGIAQTTVAYHLRKFHTKAQSDGADKVLLALAIGAGALVVAALLSDYLRGQKGKGVI